MPLVELGIPPGFDVDSGGFETLLAQGKIAKYEINGSRVSLYLMELPPGQLMPFSSGLRARYPLRVKTPPSAVYEYYQPKNRAESTPVELEIAANNLR